MTTLWPAGALHPGWTMATLPSPTLESPNLLRTASSSQDHPKNDRGGHTKSEALALQPTWCTASEDEARNCQAHACPPSLAPWIPAGDPPGTSKCPSITNTSQKYLEKRLRVSSSICWGGAVPAGVKCQFRGEKVPLETPGSGGQG